MQLTRPEIMERLRDILLVADDRNSAQIAACTEATNLTTELGLSSVGMLYLVIAIEEAFDIRFENMGLGDFATVGDVIDYIEAKIS